MNFISLAVAGLMILLTLVFAGLLMTAIVFNLKAGRKYRQSLAARVDQLRLSKMLTALGIDVASYLHSEPVVKIYTQIERCSACQNTETCDEKLSRGVIEAEDIGFCNNEQSLQGMVRKNA
jgi:hypothetical protein